MHAALLSMQRRNEMNKNWLLGFFKKLLALECLSDSATCLQQDY
jgi:hypothetical protein